MNKLKVTYKVPNDLYLELMAAVTHNTSSEVEELKDFIDGLPLLLQAKVKMLIYSNNYRDIRFL